MKGMSDAEAGTNPWTFAMARGQVVSRSTAGMAKTIVFCSSITYGMIRSVQMGK